MRHKPPPPGTDKPVTLTAALEAVYDDIQRRGDKPKRNRRKDLTLAQIQIREEFIEHCLLASAAVKAWGVEYAAALACAVDGGAPHFPFPLYWLPYVRALAESGADWHTEADVRRLLGCGAREEEIDKWAVPRRQRKVASNPRVGRRDPLTKEIGGILKRRPDITPPELIDALHYRVCPVDGPIVDVHDNGIVSWVDEEGEVHDVNPQDLAKLLAAVKRKRKRIKPLRRLTG